MVQKNYSINKNSNETPLGTTEKKPPYQTFGDNPRQNDGTGRKSPAPISHLLSREGQLEYSVNTGQVPRTDNKASLNNSKVNLLENPQHNCKICKAY